MGWNLPPACFAAISRNGNFCIVGITSGSAPADPALSAINSGCGDTDDTKSALHETRTIRWPAKMPVGAPRMPTRASSSARDPRRAKPRTTPGHTALSEERYALALESLNFGVFDWNIDTDTVYYSPTLRIMLGLSEAELSKPADWISLMHLDDLPLYRRRLAEHLKGHTPRFECDTRYRSGDNTWRWARQQGIAMRRPDGRAYRLVGATGDVTEIKNQERAAVAAAAAHRAALASGEDRTRNEERFALALQAINENVYDWDIDAHAVYVSPSLIAMQDLPANATVEQWAERIHPEDRPYHRSMLIALFKGDIPRLDCEFRYCMPDGTVRWARQHGIVLRGADGRARRMIGATGDITEERQRAQQLEHAKAEAVAAHRDSARTREVMAVMLDNMSHGVAMFDRDLKLAARNRQFEEMFELPDDFCASQPKYSDLIRYTARRVRRRRYREAHRPRSRERRLEVRHRAHASGRYRRRDPAQSHSGRRIRLDLQRHHGPQALRAPDPGERAAHALDPRRQPDRCGHLGRRRPPAVLQFRIRTAERNFTRQSGERRPHLAVHRSIGARTPVRAGARQGARPRHPGCASPDRRKALVVALFDGPDRIRGRAGAADMALRHHRAQGTRGRASRRAGRGRAHTCRDADRARQHDRRRGAV